jgi:hypothetical protein
LVYVGKAASKDGFRGRYYKYRAELNATDSDRPLINRMINKWHSYLWFCYADVADSDIVTVENELIKAYLPSINSEFPADISAAMRAF